MFVLVGVVGDRKRAVIEANLKKKKAEDIASGKEAMIAARQSKQILDVMSDAEIAANATSYDATGSNSDNTNANVDPNANPLNNVVPIINENTAKDEEKAPSVLVIDANGNSSEVKNTNNPSNTLNNQVTPPVSNPNLNNIDNSNKS